MTVITRRHAAVAGVLTTGVLVAVTACGSSGSSGSPGSSGASGSSGSSSGGASANGVHTVANPALGTIVVDGKGFTLYRFDADTAKPSASHCTGQCTALWPVVPATATNAVTGVDHSLIGSVTRGDGTKQLTIAGWPIYTFAEDSKAGDTHGQGFFGFGAKWWAVTPTGAKAAGGSGSSSGSSSGSGSGSGSGSSSGSSSTNAPSSGGGYGY